MKSALLLLPLSLLAFTGCTVSDRNDPGYIDNGYSAAPGYYTPAPVTPVYPPGSYNPGPAYPPPSYPGNAYPRPNYPAPAPNYPNPGPLPPGPGPGPGPVVNAGRNISTAMRSLEGSLQRFHATINQNRVTDANLLQYITSMENNVNEVQRQLADRRDLDRVHQAFTHVEGDAKRVSERLSNQRDLRPYLPAFEPVRNDLHNAQDAFR